MIESDDRTKQDDQAEKGSTADSSEGDSTRRKTRDWKAEIEEEEAARPPIEPQPPNKPDTT